MKSLGFAAFHSLRGIAKLLCLGNGTLILQKDPATWRASPITKIRLVQGPFKLLIVPPQV